MGPCRISSSSIRATSRPWSTSTRRWRRSTLRRPNTGSHPRRAAHPREPRAHFVIADGHPSNAFVAVTARVGPGRPAEDKRSFVEALLQATQRAFANPVLDIAYSVELQEIDPEFRINVNEIRPKLAERTRRRAHTDP
ncbi:MAG: hypothetical protein R2705_15060 [Ilumatobacteraceae bacterium]